MPFLSWHTLFNALVVLPTLAITLLAFLPTRSEMFDAHPPVMCPTIRELAEIPPHNEKLKDTIRLGEGLLKGLETVTFANNSLFGFQHDGSIVRFQDGKVSQWAYVGGRPLAGKFDSSDNLVVTEVEKGIIKVNAQTKEITVLSHSVYLPDEGRWSPLSYVDDVEIASDGKIYFSDGTAIHPWRKAEGGVDILEPAKLSALRCVFDGRVLVYDPDTRQTSVVATGLGFANGVALAPDETFLVVAESFLNRLSRIWLKGPKKGSVERFTQDLYCLPDGVSYSKATDSFWLACANKPHPILHHLQAYPRIRNLIARLPKAIKPKALSKIGLVMEISKDGKVLDTLWDKEGTYTTGGITSVTEHKGKLYLGTLKAPFVPVYDLKHRGK